MDLAAARTTLAFVTDGDGKRRSIHDSDGLRYIRWDQENTLSELNDLAAIIAPYTLNPQAYGELVSQRRSGATSFHHFDALGSTNKLTDSSANTLAEYLYRAFGEQSLLSGSSANRFTWVGRLGYYRAPDPGAYWVRARFVVPTVGKWMSRDPAQAFALGNYLYADNNPVNAVDPSGLVDCAKWLQYADWADRASGFRPNGAPLCGGASHPDYVNKVHYLYNEIIKYVEAKGWLHVSQALRHFLGASGQDLRLRWEWLESHAEVRAAKRGTCNAICERLVKGHTKMNISHYVSPYWFHEDLYGTLGVFRIRGQAWRLGLGDLACGTSQYAVRVNWELWDQVRQRPGEYYDWHPGLVAGLQCCGRDIPDNWAYCLDYLYRGVGGSNFWHLSEYRTRFCLDCAPVQSECAARCEES